VDYRVALSALQRPDPTDPDALRQTLNARRKIRERHFSPDEYTALFGQEEELDRFTIARLEIARDTGLTPQQKQAALREAEQQLSDAHRAARADTVLHQTVAAQTAAFDAAGVDPQRRYELRRVAYGEAAAQELAQLDREEQEWQARLARYAAAKAAGGTEQLETLKQQLFTAQEQLRLDAALALRATPAR
jgi:lipase chaperone LimK